jgi:hypothetical protein
MCGKYLRLEELSAVPIASAVRETLTSAPEVNRVMN